MCEFKICQKEAINNFRSKIHKLNFNYQILLKLIGINIQSVLHGYELSKRMTEWKLNSVNTKVHKNKVVYGILKLSAPSWKKRKY